MIAIEEFCQALNLEPLTQTTRKEMDINVTDLNRPGMQFCGFYEFFAAERPQVIGKVEMTYLESIEPTVREKVLRRYLSYDLPCIVCCWGMTPPKELLQIATERDIPVFMSRVKTTKFTLQAIMYLNRVLAPHVTRHGVLVDVYGVGVLLTGECPEMVRHFMEIRGIGIIDIRAMYGVGSVILSKSIDMVIHMEKWDSTKEYDRLGLTEETVSILGVKVPYQVMPVKPGRNLAIIIEVAARNLSLKRMGYSAAHELDRRLNEMIAQNSSNGDSANS